MQTNRDDFEFFLAKQYSDSVDEVMFETRCSKTSEIDYESFDLKIRNLIKAARVDGLKEEIVWNIIERKVPGYISHLNFQEKIYKNIA